MIGESARRGLLDGGVAYLILNLSWNAASATQSGHRRPTSCHCCRFQGYHCRHKSPASLRIMHSPSLPPLRLEDYFFDVYSRQRHAGYAETATQKTTARRQERAPLSPKLPDLPFPNTWS